MITKRVRTCIAILAIDLAFALPSMSQIFKTTPVVYLSGGNEVQKVVMADVNRDGKPDVIVTNAANNQYSGGLVGVLLGNGDGTFQAAVTYAVSPGVSGVAVGDLNGDGWPDIAVGSLGVEVLLNNGDGTFQAAVGYSSAVPA